MTETNAPTATPRPKGKNAFWFGLFSLVMTGLAIAAFFCPWFITVPATQALHKTVPMEQGLTRLETQVKAPSETASFAPSTSPSLPDFVRLQNDVTSLSSALKEVQAEVKQSQTYAAQTALITSIAFTQLSLAATEGKGYAPALATLRTVRKDTLFQEQLNRLDPYASKGAPTLASLQKQFAALAPHALKTIHKTEAHTWQEHIVVAFKELVSIRKLNEEKQETTDPFATLESALAQGDLAAVLEAHAKLPAEAQQVLGDWIRQVEARHNLDEALNGLAATLTLSAQP